MALFSFFGKKKSQAENLAEAKDATSVESQQESAPEPASVNDTIERETNGVLRTQRNIARMTAEKIDAIESEIARDILKYPSSSQFGSADDSSTEEIADPTTEDSSNSLFHTTLIRVDKETMILFREDMDE